MGKIKSATQQDTEGWIFGSGCLSYSWWGKCEKVGWDYDPETLEAPDGWKWSIECDDPEGFTGPIVKEITHADLMRAARKLASKGFTLRDDVRQEARNLIFNADDADFDADMADVLLQTAVLGEVVYG
ncbi:hypothetical protein [Streptomyces sp. NPDC004682]